MTRHNPAQRWHWTDSVCLATLLLVVVAHLLPPARSQWFAAVQLMHVWLLAGGFAAGLVALAIRRRLRSAATALLVVTFGIAWFTPIWDPPWASSPACAANTGVRVLSANMLRGAASVPDLVRAVEAKQSDVIAMSEVTPALAASLKSALSEHPHSIGFVDPDGFAGTYLFSRWRLTDAGSLPTKPGQFSQPRAVVHSPNGSVRVAAVHILPPLGSGKPWVDGLANLTAFAQADDSMPTVLMGDFNATLAHSPFRDLVDTAIDDRDRTAPWRGTWGPTSLFPLAKIDHILVRGARVADDGVVSITGSDHRAVHATVCTRP